MNSPTDPKVVGQRVWKERSLFLLNFLKNPLRNASIIPSSKTASRAMLAGIQWDKINTVVELGPGNGTFTAEILAHGRPEMKVILIELEETYVQLLRKKFGERVTVVHDGADRMNAILSSMQLEYADLIVSGLPFLKKEISGRVFAAIKTQTDRGAVFRFFTYMPPVMKWFYRSLPVQEISFVWRNIPPMWVYGIN